MKILTVLREHERRLTRHMAAWDSPWARRVLPPVEDAAQHTKLWWAAAVTMAAGGGRRGRRAAAAGIGGMALAELLSNGVAKQLVDRRRPPKEWIPHDDVEDRPDSSSFPSGHTAAAVAFTTAVAPAWPVAAAVCAVPALLVGIERIHSGAHYPSDVAAGAAVGLTAAALVRASPRLPRLLLRRRMRTLG
ncbi:phosphatidic acid phosphatase [Streptomyces sp. CB00455]|uniref:phosphatase PAP2 family protein n=1 Tax=Streptomyces sp. CB00455 TaxID=1703927 RepID=UPI00093BC006|nr:phosphatase PAP2 family protein [Streptomyces sp. CB00455]OKK15993.1 phosphatidic acid phosphatase [Streptomyces sp. CB00455]